MTESNRAAPGQLAAPDPGPEPVPDPPRSAPAPDRRPSAGGVAWGQRLTSPGAVAVLVWLVTLPLAFAIPRITTLDPFSNHAMAVVLSTAFVGLALVVGCAWRWRHRAVSGVAAGLAASWTAFTLQMALYGTPFGFGGMQGDMVRMAALVTRYSETAVPSDAWVKNVTAEYPILYPWLIGRAASVLDYPAWRLLAEAETLVISAAVVVAFILWRRWVSGWAAFAIAIASVSIFGDPRKAFEVVALAIFVPWVIGTFGSPPRGRIHWLLAGVLAALLYLLYPGWMIYGALGMLVLAWLSWRAEARRWQYVAYLAKVVLVAVLVASWQLFPYAWALLTRSPETVSDLYDSPTLNANLLPLLDFTPLGLLQLVGFIGMVWLVRSVWWARPILILALAAFAYRVLMMLRFAATDHTMFLHYSARLYTVALAIGGVLVLAHIATELPGFIERRLGGDGAAAARHALWRVGVAALALAVAWLGYTYARHWMPSSDATYSATAHLEPLPGGGYPQYAPASGRLEHFPVREVEDFVEESRDGAGKPIVLSSDERLFAYLPWYGYLGEARSATSSLVRWDTREDELRSVLSVTDPAAFASATRQMRYGSIDVFVLEAVDGVLKWRDVEISREQFGAAQWATAELPSGTFVAVRR